MRYLLFLTGKAPARFCTKEVVVSTRRKWVMRRENARWRLFEKVRLHYSQLLTSDDWHNSSLVCSSDRNGGRIVCRTNQNKTTKGWLTNTGLESLDKWSKKFYKGHVPEEKLTYLNILRSWVLKVSYSRCRSWSDGVVGDPPCINISYSSWLVPRAEKGPRPCNKMGYVLAMY